jgi:hypothetical protein
MTPDNSHNQNITPLSPDKQPTPKDPANEKKADKVLRAMLLALNQGQPITKEQYAALE